MVEHLLDKELSFCLCDPAITVVNGRTQWQGNFLVSRETLLLFDWTQPLSTSHFVKMAEIYLGLNSHLNRFLSLAGDGGKVTSCHFSCPLDLVWLQPVF